jgi:hypothetical protein
MELTPFQKRAPLFLIGCISLRYYLTYIAQSRRDLLPNLGKLAIVPAVGFLLIYTLKLRKVGVETLGQPIWWNSLRPLHGVLWAIFAYMAINSHPDAWKVLLADTSIGLIAWSHHHGLL